MVDGEDTAFGWNRYMYTRGNPIRYKDPTGHFEIVEGTIEKGDTLSKIATDITKEYGQKVGVKGLLKLNPQIKNPDKIFIGDKLNIPFKLQGMEGGFSNSILKGIGALGQSDNVRKVISLSKQTGVQQANSHSAVLDILNRASSKVSPNDTTNRDLLSFAASAATSGRQADGSQLLVLPFRRGIGNDKAQLRKGIGNDKAQHFFFSSYLSDKIGSNTSNLLGHFREIGTLDFSIEDTVFNKAGIDFSNQRGTNASATPSQSLEKFRPVLDAFNLR